MKNSKLLPEILFFKNHILREFSLVKIISFAFTLYSIVDLRFDPNLGLERMPIGSIFSKKKPAFFTIKSHVKILNILVRFFPEKGDLIGPIVEADRLTFW